MFISIWIKMNGAIGSVKITDKVTKEVIFSLSFIEFYYYY